MMHMRLDWAAFGLTAFQISQPISFKTVNFLKPRLGNPLGVTRVSLTCSLLGVLEQDVGEARRRAPALPVDGHGLQPEPDIPLQPAHRPHRLLRRQVYPAQKHRHHVLQIQLQCTKTKIESITTPT